jgi:hypothetical protein
MVGFGLLDDPRVKRSLDYQAASITGQGDVTFCKSATSGPGFRCAMNYGDPCAGGATKAVLALARVPTGRRMPAVAKALEQGAAFLLSRDPSTADYPMAPTRRQAAQALAQPRLRVGEHTSDTAPFSDAGDRRFCARGGTASTAVRSTIVVLGVGKRRLDQRRWRATPRSRTCISGRASEPRDDTSGRKRIPRRARPATPGRRHQYRRHQAPGFANRSVRIGEPKR